MALADDFFRLSHNDRTGRPLLHPVALSTGLAAALVGELVWTGHVRVYAGRMYPQVGEPSDLLAAKVLAVLRRERHPLPVWLEYLAQGAVAEVAARLERAGHIRIERSHRRGRRHAVRYVPLELLVASRPWVVLALSLNSGELLEPEYVCLAGLMAATGLDATLLVDAPSSAHARVRALVAELPDGMRELLAHTEALVGGAVLSPRT